MAGRFWSQAPPPLDVPQSSYYTSSGTPQSARSPRYPRGASASSPHYSHFPPPTPARNDLSYRHVDPRTLQQHFDYRASDYDDVPRDSRRSPHGSDLGDRPPSPHYRHRSRGSSTQASSTAKVAPPQSDPAYHNGYRRHKRSARPRRQGAPPGYKAPTVETAPNSPTLLPSLSSDADSVFVTDEDYLSSQTHETARRQNGHGVRMDSSGSSGQRRNGGGVFERERKPYAGSTATESTAASSPPPADPPICLERQRRAYGSTGPASDKGDREEPVFRERERRQYSNVQQQQRETEYDSPPPEAQPRQSHPYAYTPTHSTVESAPKRRSGQYGSSGADLPYARENPGWREEPHAHTHSPPDDYRQPEDYRQPDDYRGQPLGSASSVTSHHSHQSSTPQPYQQPRESREPQVEPHSIVRRPSTPGPESEFLDLIPSCPKRQLVNRGHWFALPSIPGFHVCERCYELHIHDTKFKYNFVDYVLKPGQSTYCAFNTPRVLKVVWPHTVYKDQFPIFEGYAQQRAQLMTCAVASSSPRGVWYTIHAEHSNAGFIACQACYEDVVLASPFSQYFTRLDAANPGGLMSCHLSVAFIENQLVDENIPWSEFLHVVEHRLHRAANCPGERSVTDPARRWWKPSPSIPLTYICDACYLDGIHNTPFSDQFTPVFQEAGADRDWFCAMGLHGLSHIWKHAVERNDYDVWHNAAVSAMSPCGQHSRDWFTFKTKELREFTLCGRCSKTYFEPLRFDKQLVQSSHISSRQKCDLDSPYRARILAALGEAADWREFSIFVKFLAPRITSIPCPGAEAVRRVVWYGTPADEFRVCEECWKWQVKFSPLSRLIGRVRPRAEGGLATCDLGTEEGRKIWDMACRTGPANLKMKPFHDLVERVRNLEDIREELRHLIARLESGGDGVRERRRLEEQVREATDDEMGLVEELRHLGV